MSAERIGEEAASAPYLFTCLVVWEQPWFKTSPFYIWQNRWFWIPANAWFRGILSLGGGGREKHGPSPGFGLGLSWDQGCALPSTPFGWFSLSWLWQEMHQQILSLLGRDNWFFRRTSDGPVVFVVAQLCSGQPHFLMRRGRFSDVFGFHAYILLLPFEPTTRICILVPSPVGQEMIPKALAIGKACASHSRMPPPLLCFLFSSHSSYILNHSISSPSNALIQMNNPNKRPPPPPNR